MRTIRATLTWSDGHSISVSGSWARDWDDAQVSYTGSPADLDRLLKLMPWQKQLPTTFCGCGFEGMWNFAKPHGVTVAVEESGDWIAREL